MRRLLWLVFSFAFLSAAGRSAAARTEIRVTDDRVNLRPEPSEQTEAVCQVSKGDILLTDNDLDVDWVEIIPPSGVDLWVYGELVRDGVVAASRVLVRAGPGINYKAVGGLEKGDKVTIRGVQAEWLKIAPPAGCTLWISGKYVEPVVQSSETRPAAAVAIWHMIEKPIVTPKPALEPVPRKIVLRVDLPHEPVKETLVPSKEQGKAVQYEGILGPSGFVWHRPSKYRLVKRDKKGRMITACYVLGNESRLAPVAGRTVVIYGREYWIQGVRYPVVVPKQIVRKD